MAKTVNDIGPGGAIVAQGSVANKVPGDRKWTFKRITGDNNYPAGGYPLLPGDLGFAFQLEYAFIINDGVGAPGAGNANLSWFYNTVTQSLQLIVVSTGLELAAASNASTCTCDIAAIGR